MYSLVQVTVYYFQPVMLFGVTAFYRAMHFSAKRGIEIACRLSVRDVGGSGSHRLEILETNCTDK